MLAYVKAASLPHGTKQVGTGELRVLVPLLFLLAGILLAVRILPVLGAVICLVAAAHALRGSKQVIQAFLILAFLLLLGGAETSVARWVVLFTGFARVLWDVVFLGASFPRLFGPLLLFFVTVLLFSVTASAAPAVSIFKLLSFMVGSCTLLIAFRATAADLDYWKNVIFTLGLFIVFASIPVLLLGGGYERTSAGFQGILSHPQTFGPVLAPVAALFTGMVLFKAERRWFVRLAVVFAWSGIFLSSSRTAMLALVGGFCVMLAVSFLWRKAWWRSLQLSIFKPATFLGVLLVVFLVALQWTSLSDKALGFLVKDDSATGSIAESLQSSRGGLIETSIDNFYSAPLTGIGFGVPSDASRLRVQTGMFGLPTGASVEKGFMPSAVLEETGLGGALFVFLMILYLVRAAARQDEAVYFWMMVSALMVNLGEMIFFSFGGMGFYFWIVMALVYTLGESGHAGFANRVYPPAGR